MVSPTQRQNASRDRIRNLANPSTVWFWVGWDVGKEGQVGIVRDGDGNQQRGIVYGNIQPRSGDTVAFSPGQPIGSINVGSVGPPGGGGGGRVPGADIVIQDNPPVDPPNNPKTIWIDRTAITAYAWDAEALTPAWLGPISGGTILYGEGDPTIDLELEWQPQTQFYDTTLNRLFLAGPPENTSWLPTGPYSFDPSSYAVATTFYGGDTYQATDGAFYRLNSSGQWVMQWFCPDCAEEPEPGPPDACNPGYVGWNTVGGVLSQWIKC